MKKLRKRLIIILVLAGVLYGGYMLFINPSGYKDETELTQDFFKDIHSSTACDTYFNPETITYCESFTALFDGQTVVIDTVSTTPAGATVTITVGTTSTTFFVTFVETPVTGIKRFFNKTYITIDLIV